MIAFLKKVYNNNEVQIAQLSSSTVMLGVLIRDDDGFAGCKYEKQM